MAVGHPDHDPRLGRRKPASLGHAVPEPGQRRLTCRLVLPGAEHRRIASAHLSPHLSAHMGSPTGEHMPPGIRNTVTIP